MHLSRPARAAGLAAAALYSFLATARAEDLNPTEKRLIAAAKAEGEVTILNAVIVDETAVKLSEAFIKRYGLGPNFKVNNVRKGTGQTAAQIRQEIQAGKVTSDVFILTSPLFFEELAKRGALLALDSSNWKNHEELAKAAGQYFNYPYMVLPFAYTFQPTWNSACPGMESIDIRSYQDLLNPALKGKIVVSDLSKSISYSNTVAAMYEAGLVDFPKLWQGIKALDPIIEFRTEAKMQMIVSCERPLDMFNTSGRVIQNVEKKPALANTLKLGSYKEGQVMLGNQASVMKGSPHPNAGQLMLEFMLGKQGTDILVAGEGLYSFMKGYKAPHEIAPFMLDLDKVKLVGMKQWTGPEAQGDFKTVREAWQQVFQ